MKRNFEKEFRFGALFLAALIYFLPAGFSGDVEPKQVQVEAKLVEVSNDFSREVGTDLHGGNDLDHQTTNVQVRSQDSGILFGAGVPQELLNPATPAQTELKLEVTPTITDDGHVKMDVQPADESIVLGGLTTQADKKETSVPFLSNIPVLGALFKNKARADQKENLLVFVTPQMVQSDSED